MQSVANENALSMCPAMMMLTKVKERACSPQCVEDGREGCVGACWDMVGERVCQWWQYTRYIHSFKGMRYHFQLLFSSVFLKKCSSTLKTHVSCTRSVGTAMVWNVCCMGAGGCKRAQQTRVLRLLHPLTTSTKIRGKGEGGGSKSKAPPR